MFRIDFTPDARDELKAFRKYEQQQIIEGIEDQLAYQAAQETRNRKRLRPNRLAEWELRVGTFRVFYDIDEDNLRVMIEAVGQKLGNKLFIHGDEYHL